VTNSERRISRQRAFLEPPGEAKPDWWIICKLAQRLGHGDAFAYRSPAEIFAEHAALSAFENNGSRAFDLGALEGISNDAYHALPPFQWPQSRQPLSAKPSRLFASGDFFTRNGRARFVPVGAPPETTAAAKSEFPLRLNTGRIRDQWHTMTRTGKSPRLTQHLSEPYAEIHPDDAARFGLTDGGLVRVRSAHGEAIMRVVVNSRQRRGSVFAPIHWSDENTSGGRIGALVHGRTDPISGQPDSKATPCTVEPCAFGIEGFVLSHEPLPVAAPYWVRIRLETGWLYRVAFQAEPEPSWSDWTEKLFDADQTQLLQLSDPRSACYRAAHVRDDRLAGCLFIAARGQLPGWDWLARLLGEPVTEDVHRRCLLAGRESDGIADHGPIICACFAIGRNRIARAVAADGCHSVDALGAALRAGTNCGSCIPELRRIIARETAIASSPEAPARC
jgi:assimilatory nitrate reductase catalytic subunit